MADETLTIDPEGWTVVIGDHAVQLTYLEFRLLLFLAEPQGKVFGRADLLHAVWPNVDGVSHRSVDLYIHRLREKLGASGRRAIQTVVRVGYRFEPKGAGILHLVPAEGAAGAPSAAGQAG